MPLLYALGDIAQVKDASESLMHHTGLLITSWPAVLGCDASGVIIETGPEVNRLKKGDYVFGCTRLGVPGHSVFQESFLMDEDVTVKQVGKVTVENAPTIGVGLYTAALCLLKGLKLIPPTPGDRVEQKDEWIIVYGASGSVGQFGIQLSRLCGYKCLATSSNAKSAVCIANGANAVLDHGLSAEQQLDVIKKTTGGKFARVFDAGGHSYDVSIEALETVSTAAEEKLFASVDDWSNWNVPPSVSVYRAKLGPIGRVDDPIGAETTRDVASWVDSFEGLLSDGLLKPLDYELSENIGWQAVIDGIELLESGKAEKKILVRVQDG
ncbi:hypothetical protein BX600DRAFT_518086 [Xylariales sp. PMI_506]|nr:hypothetical protein BX600DRAFT_518086 [Xylariales sp. PMI_506]